MLLMSASGWIRTAEGPLFWKRARIRGVGLTSTELREGCGVNMRHPEGAIQLNDEYGLPLLRQLRTPALLPAANWPSFLRLVVPTSGGSSVSGTAAFWTGAPVPRLERSTSTRSARTALPVCNEALAWGCKAAVACRAPVEVRPIL